MSLFIGFFIKCVSLAKKPLHYNNTKIKISQLVLIIMFLPQKHIYLVTNQYTKNFFSYGNMRKFALLYSAVYTFKQS